MRSWNELSMAEKADIMKLAIEGGVYDLDSIRMGYNKFAEGGGIHIKPSHRGRLTELKERTGKSEAELYNDGNPAHKKMVVFARNARKWKHGDGGNLYGNGGLTSLITTPVLPDVKEIRHRLYNGVNPAGYQHIPERIWEALNGKEANKSIYRDDQWATYLQIPEEERHRGVEKLKPARYKPSKGAPEGDVYRVTLNNEDIDNLIESVKLLGLNIGENTVDRSLDKYFGSHTIGRGYDEKGEYVSYYDKYDLNPFAGATRMKTGIKSFDKWLSRNTILPNSDLSMGIGKPFEIYDRIYLDDYYGVPKEARGATFLPEITVIGKKKKVFGGNLFEIGGPKRQPAQARPATKNRFENVSAEEIEAINKANEEYWRNQQEELDNRTPEQIEQMGAEADKEYRLRRPNGGEADPELQRVNGVVMSALSDVANSTPFTSDEVEEAAKQQVENKLNTWKPIINTADIATNAVGIMSGNPWLLGAAAIPDVFQTIDHAANEGITANDLLSLGFDGLGILGATNILRPLKLTYRQRTTNRYGLPIERDQEVQYGKYLDAFSDWGGKAWGIKDGGDDAVDLWNFGKKITPNTQFYFRPFGLAEEVSR